MLWVYLCGIKIRKKELISPPIMVHVKMRSPNQGLGSIPVSKNGVLGLITESTIYSYETDPSKYWDLSQNSIFSTLGLKHGPQTHKLPAWLEIGLELRI